MDAGSYHIEGIADPRRVARAVEAAEQTARERMAEWEALLQLPLGSAWSEKPSSFPAQYSVVTAEVPAPAKRKPPPAAAAAPLASPPVITPVSQALKKRSRPRAPPASANNNNAADDDDDTPPTPKVTPAVVPGDKRADDKPNVRTS